MRFACRHTVMRGTAAMKAIEHHDPEQIHLVQRQSHSLVEMIEEQHRDNRDQQTGAGSNQRFSNASGTTMNQG